MRLIFICRLTEILWFFQVFCGSISSLRREHSWRYRAEVGKLVRRLAVRASGPDAVALMQASCACTQTLRLRHGASDWETASGGLGSSWKGGPGFVRATADATKRVPPDLRLSTFDLRLSWLSHAAERPSQSAGERPRPRGRAGGAGSLLRCGGRHAAECACAFPAVSKVRRGSVLSRFVTTHFPQFSLKSHFFMPACGKQLFGALS